MLSVISFSASAQQSMSSTMGRDFWVGFLHNGQQDRLMDGSGYSLAQATAANVRRLVANAETAGTVTATCGTWSTTVNVPAGGSVTIDVPYESGTTPIMRYTRPCYSRRIYNAGIHVTSTVDISLYALNYISASFDATTVLPTSTLGTHYLLQDFNYPTTSYLPDAYDGGQMCVVATENNTTVNIQFNTATVIDSFAFSTPVYTASIHTNQIAGSSFRTITLQAGQYMQLITPSTNSLTGAEITSNRPVAVFMGRKRCTVPHSRRVSNGTSTYTAPDHLYEQAVPTNMWGKTFLVVPDHRTGGYYDYINIVSLEADCHLTVDGTGLSDQTIATAGGNLLLNMPSNRTPLYIKSDKPISVSLYMSSYSFRGNEGDPSSVIIPPMEQATNHAVFNAYSTSNSTTHRANVVVRNDDVSGMRLDGTNISSLFTAFGTTDYSYAKVPVTAGAHTLSNTVGKFNAWFYGMGPMESYAYTAAMKLLDLQHELYVDGDNGAIWGDTISVCQNTTHYFKIETDGPTDTRWYVDNSLQSSTDTTLGYTFNSAGTFTITALQRGGCTAPDFCDTLRLVVRVRPIHSANITPTVYADSLPYTLNGEQYSSAGSYSQVLTGTNGCDSLLSISLSVRPHSFDDHATSFANSFTVLYPTENDTLPCTNPSISIVTMPLHGTPYVCGSGGNEGAGGQGGGGELWAPPPRGPQPSLCFPSPDGEGAGTSSPICVTYTPYNDFVGCDSMRIAVCCSGLCDSSWIYFSVILRPDNIVTADCTVRPDSNIFAVKELFSTPYTINSMSIPLVADIDGDGYTEIIGCKFYSGGTIVQMSSQSNGIQIFDGQTGALKRSISTSPYSINGQGLCIADANRDGQAEFYVFCFDYKLRCYSSLGALLWTSTTLDGFYFPAAADLMGDGNVEIVCGPYIFKASDGTLLLQGALTASGTGVGCAANPNFQVIHMFAVGDIDGDGRQEIAAGHALYKPTITNYNGTAGNIWSTVRTASSNPGIVNYDGKTCLLDFDGDGDIDICVLGQPNTWPLSNPSTQRFDTYVWDGQTSDIMAHANYYIEPSQHGVSIPYCGDLDGNGTPEIVFNICGSTSEITNTMGGMMVYTFDTALTGNMRLVRRHVPFAESVGFTVFDFNQDKRNEIVFRNSTHFFIVDGVTMDTLCTPITTYSGTQKEYLIVADVNNDGHAEILFTNSNTPFTGTGTDCQGKITVYGSAIPGAWSSARKVWNQWAYNSVNINEDLTVPRYPLDPATRFPNGKQPYNRFLGQMPLINEGGNPFNLAADAAIDTATAAHSSVSDSIVITVNYCNQGDNHLYAPYGIAVYRNQYRGTLLWVDTVRTQLDVDSCASYSFKAPISAFCGLVSTDSLLIAVNDMGVGIAQNGGQQPECDTTNNTIKIAAIAYHNTGDTIAIVCDSFTWWGNTYNISTETPTHTFINASGCDSVVTLNLAINYSNTGTDTVTDCSSYTWHGVEYTTSNSTATFTETNAAGCDSIVTLNLTVNHSTDSTITFFAFADDLPLTVEGTSYTEFGYYQQHLTNAFGCDSTLNIQIIRYPDNIEDVSCSFDAESSPWDAHLLNYTPNNIQNYYMPLVGDIDGDGIVEIVATVNTGDQYLSNKIRIFRGTDLQIISTINISQQIYSGDRGAYALVRYPNGSGGMQSAIIVHCYDGKLRSYNINGTLLATSNVVTPASYGAVSVADFNHDGWPEVIFGNAIFDAASLQLLCAGPSTGNMGRYGSVAIPHAANVVGDESLELICGNTVYGVNIASRSNPSLNSVSVLKTITPPTGYPQDGFTLAADFDRNGSLDILVVRMVNDINYFYSYDPDSEQILFNYQRNCTAVGFPLVGDIDGDGNLEFVFIDRQNSVANARINAIKYTPGSGLSTMFQAHHTDRSGQTAMTLFDFNQDGIMEIVYRDESLLRIINASGKSHRTGNDTISFYNLYSTTMICGTGYEYPVIADVNGDGAAEVITCGRISGAAATSLSGVAQSTGRLVVIGGIHPWAPARRVWNQFAYNVTNINEDLTVPRYLFNNATFFTDPNGFERQPFNNFLQQATIIDQYGRPYRSAPDVAVTTGEAICMPGEDSVATTVYFHNQGDKTLNAPYGIAVYRNQYRGTLLWVDTVRTQLDVDSCASYSFKAPISAFCGLVSTDSLLIAVNDMGVGIAQNGGQQPECDTTNNTIKIAAIAYHNTGDTTATACDSFIWWNNTYTASTETPTHTYSNTTGCDSVVTLHLTVNHSSTGDTFATACDSFTWWGNAYTASTETPTHTFTNVGGCDSVVTLHLTVNQSSTGIDDTAVCDSFTWIDGNTYITSNNTATHTLSNANSVGCDSTVSLNLTINHCSTTDTLARDSIIIGGTTITSDTTVIIGHDTIRVTVCRTVREQIDTAACNQFTWNTLTLTRDTTIIDTVAKPDGCDSITTLNLTINHCSTTDTLARDSIIIGGTTITSDTTVILGHDTINVTVCRTVREQIDTAACNQFTWNNLLLVHDTTIIDTVHKPDQCDSITTLNLTINHCSTTDTLGRDSIIIGGTTITSDTTVIIGHDTINVTVCRTVREQIDTAACNQFTWNNLLLVHDTTIIDTVHKPDQCDSITILNLTINHCSTTDTLGRDSIIIGGTTITTDTTVIIGHDTINVTVCRTVREQIDTAACNQFTWNNQLLVHDTTIIDTVHKPDQCDSITTLNLVVNYSTNSVVQDVVLENNLPYMIAGVSFTNDTNNALITITNDAGCDSNISFTLTVLHNVTADRDSVLCENQLPLIWNDSIFTVDELGNGNTLSKTTILTAATGADSILTMTVNVIRTTYSTIEDTAAISELPHSYLHHTYSYAVQNDTLHILNDAGCDSIITYTLHVWPSVNVTFDSTVCIDELPLIWYDSIFTAAGEKQLLTTAISGADSIVTLSLTVAYPVSETLNDTILQNDLPYIVGNNSYGLTSFTVLNDRVSRLDDTLHLYTVNGCDSTVILNIIMQRNVSNTIETTICDNQLPYLWNGETFTSAGSRQLTLTAASGADSLVTMVLNVNQTSSEPVNLTICPEQLPYTWRDTTFNVNTASSSYTLHRTNNVGCDSTVTLTLVVHSTSDTEVEYTICRDQLPFEWNGEELNPSLTGHRPSVTTHTTTVPDHNGCDSTATLQLTVYPVDTVVDHQEYCDHYVWIDGIDYTESTNQPLIHTGNIYGCDSTVNLDLTILQSANTHVADSFCTGTSYYFNGRTLQTGGTFYDTLQAANHCDSVVTLTLTLLPIPEVSIDATPDCETQTNNVHVNSNVDFVYWSVNGNWNNDWGSEYGRNLRVHTPQPVTLTVRVDYNEYITCPNFAAVTLSPVVQPTAVINVTPQFLSVDNPTLTAISQSTGASTLQWYVNDNDAGRDATIQYTVDNTEDSVVLQLFAYNDACYDSTSRTIYVRQQTIFAPNAFTPDESTNKTFHILCNGVIDYELYIYNRAGVLVFSGDQDNSEWDGTLKGQPCPQESYVYIVFYHSVVDPKNLHTTKGTVTLLR